MTTKNENTPAPAATGDEGNESIAERSTTTVYLAKWGDNTGRTYGTWGGFNLPMDQFISVLLPARTAQEIVAYGPRAIDISRPCADAQSAEVRKRREKESADRRRNRKNSILNELFEESPEMQQLEARMVELEKELEQQALARLEEEAEQ